MSNGSNSSAPVPMEDIEQAPNPLSSSTAGKYKCKESSTVPPQNAQGDPVLKVWIMSLNRHVSTDEIVRGLNKIEYEDVRRQSLEKYKMPLPTAIASTPALGSNAGARQSGPAGIGTYAAQGADNQATWKLQRRPVLAVKACSFCRTKKLRCDSVQPNCGNCTRRAIKCDFGAAPKRLRRLPPPPTIDACSRPVMFTTLNDRAPQLASATRDHEQASDNLQSPFPVNIVPLPGSQPGYHNKWKLLEASRENWNPNVLEPLTSNGISPLLDFTRRDHHQAPVLADLAKLYNFTPRPELRPFPDSHPYLYYLFAPPPTAALRTQAVVHPTLVPISRSTIPEITGPRGRRTAASDRGGSMKAGEVSGLMYENVPLIDIHTGVVHYPGPGHTSGMTSFLDPRPAMSPLLSPPCQFCGTTTSNIPCSCIEIRSLTPTIATTTTARQRWQQCHSDFRSSQPYESPSQIVYFPSFKRRSHTFDAERTPLRTVRVPITASMELRSSMREKRRHPLVPPLPTSPRPSVQQQQQPPPSTSPPAPSSTRICLPSIAPYSPQSQHSLSPLTPLANLPPTTPPTTSTTLWVNGSTTPRVDWLPLSFTPPNSFTSISSALQSSPPIPTMRTSAQVGGPPPDALEDPEMWEKVLQGAAILAYGNLSLSAAMQGVDSFSSNPITKVPLVIATAASFSAVMIHWLASLQLHVSQSAHHIKRPLMVLVAFLAVSVVATLFALPAHSWSQAECGPFCWVERALVSTVVIGGFASLMIGGWRMRGADARLAARVD